MQWHDYEQALHAQSQETTLPVNATVEKLVHEIIGRVADKWTMLILEALEQAGTVRFTQLGKQVQGISQKMLTKTLRQMESDGLVKRVVYPVVPPRVEYSLTSLGHSLGSAFCGVWLWAEAHHGQIEEARRQFAADHQHPLIAK
ncbi:MAG: transcriptional regulator [Moraxellaceae bacterium]|nr:MAG: transcriptional regulator [Moraxellaceae bacterium]